MDIYNPEIKTDTIIEQKSYNSDNEIDESSSSGNEIQNSEPINVKEINEEIKEITVT